ncbi:CotH kinase family protein [uncultured Clostridium sp.]|uniref:CotH kinase family protein n=1 Tax=uncultured Clostridium sp. TaxID=59620 RepID=UPI0026713ABC|nr:CotH kinase family protein [uncultured Clostridium sp.]
MLKKKEKKIIFSVAMVIGLIIICFYVVRFNTINGIGVDSSSSSQLVLDKDNVTEINIEIDENTWQELLDNATKEEYYSANVTINDETFYNVGLRTKGNSSLSNVARDENNDRYSLKVKFDKYVDGQTYHGIEKLALNNNYQDPTYMKEYLSYEIFSSLGVPTPEYSYASISINGEPWGLYLAIEDVDERYIEKYYGTVEGNIYKPETMDLNNDNMLQNGENTQDGMNGNIPTIPENMLGGMEGNIPQQMPNDIPEGGLNEITENGSGNMMPNLPVDIPEGMGNVMQGNKQDIMGGFNKGNNGGADLKYIDDNIESYSTITESAEFKTTTEEDYQKILEMIKSLNSGENLEEYLNVEEILKYFSVNTFLVNLDSYSGGMYHNYYLYERDGVFEMLPWDLNMSFAGFGVNDASSAVNFPIDSPVTGSLEDAPLIGKLLEIDSYKEIYHSYLNTLIENYIDNDGLINLVDKIHNMINDYVKNDATAFYKYEEYENSLPELKKFIENRGASIVAQLKGEQPATEYGNIEATFDLSALGGHGGGMQDGDRKNPWMNNNFNMDDENRPQIPEGIGNVNNNMQIPPG